MASPHDVGAIVDPDDERPARAPLRSVLLVVGASAFALASFLFASGGPAPVDRPPQATPAPSAPSVVALVSSPLPTIATVAAPPPPRMVRDVGTTSRETEALSSGINSWVTGPLPSTARGAWQPDTYGDELFLSHGQLTALEWIGISLDTRIPEPDCQVGTPATARELATWIQAQPSLATTPYRQVTVAGVNALVLDVTVQPTPGAAHFCAQSFGSPSGSPLIAIHESGGQRHPWTPEPGRKLRIYLLDRFSKSLAPRTVAVVVQSPNEGSFDSTIDDAGAVLQLLFTKLATYAE
jgi:hypothetical protein